MEKGRILRETENLVAYEPQKPRWHHHIIIEAKKQSAGVSSEMLDAAQKLMQAMEKEFGSARIVIDSAAEAGRFVHVSSGDEIKGLALDDIEIDKEEKEEKEDAEKNVSTIPPAALAVSFTIGGIAIGAVAGAMWFGQQDYCPVPFVPPFSATSTPHAPTSSDSGEVRSSSANPASTLDQGATSASSSTR